jgi:hypothetical protein
MQQPMEGPHEARDRASMLHHRAISTKSTETEDFPESTTPSVVRNGGIETTFSNNYDFNSTGRPPAQPKPSENMGNKDLITSYSATTSSKWLISHSSPKTISLASTATGKGMKFWGTELPDPEHFKVRDKWTFIRRPEVFATITNCLACFRKGTKFQYHLKYVHGICILTNGLFLRQASVLESDIPELVVGVDDGTAGLSLSGFDEGPISGIEVKEILKPCPLTCSRWDPHGTLARRHWRMQHGLVNLNGDWYALACG